jgi:hypothetical protein
MKTPHIRTKRVVENPNFGGGLNAHRLVAETAVEMANELFEAYALENAIYRKLRADGQVSEKAARRVFVERVAPRLLEDARGALTQCLAQPDEAVPVSMKDKIAEALIADNDLRAKRIVASDRVSPSAGFIH